MSINDRFHAGMPSQRARLDVSWIQLFEMWVEFWTDFPSNESKQNIIGRRWPLVAVSLQAWRL